MRRPYDTSVWYGKGGHATNDTYAANVTACRNIEFHEEVARLKAAADGVELVALPKNTKAQSSLHTLFNKQTLKQTSSSPRPGPYVAGSVVMATGSCLGETVSSRPVSSVEVIVASIPQSSFGVSAS